ncbi:2Fe-2S iron-sulfur cluster-binding protein [Solimonas terrae]|uniref:2Fe-2S iron-sulfur cluster binding domain-containing protein n=1 Tax=Solimonas terrae TaxID=1396819 RepID=A0A6M2BMX1_9GAMM|nr:2Fe-2S iron-sulfur cluster-binding protein [Solimonas terrae]NGY03956.1 2Fe-2S iron-sulfur cluster binding domain-containing protein [Solimonas terrae]
MPKILFIAHDGKEHLVDGASGQNLMQIATDNMVPSILGDCGGVCSCATCHGYVDPAWIDKLGPKSEEEEMMLDGALNTEPTSRLTCQIVMNDALDGIVVRLPASQI